jgi:hypothetical protein
MEVTGLLHAQATMLQEKSLHAHWLGVCMDPSHGSEERDLCPCQELNPDCPGHNQSLSWQSSPDSVKHV